ncbi:MAG TPA: DUF4382 domain-containing protein, partial [Longimicrobiales bacterium]
PGDLAEAWVKVKGVQLVADSLVRDTTARDTSKTSQLTPDSGWINLLALTDGKTKDLFSGAVRAGRYGQVRLIVCDMYIKTTDGQIIATPGTTLPSGVSASTGTELKLTSQCQSGFKVVLKGDSLRLGADSSSALVIDFDAKRSFAHEAGKSGKWIVTPVLFGMQSKGSGSTGAGSIAGTVTLAQSITLPVACGALSLSKDSLLKKFVPTARDTALHTGTTTAAGAFTIANLAPATYTMGADKLGFANGDSLFYTATSTPATVAVTAGTAGKADYAVSAVSCKPHA